MTDGPDDKSIFNLVPKLGEVMKNVRAAAEAEEALQEEEKREAHATGLAKGEEIQKRILNERQIGMFQADSDTSREAAISVYESGKTGRKRVYGYLQEVEPRGATDEEMQEALRMNPSTQRPRRGELGLLIYDTGIKRKTRSGRRAKVWRIRPKEDVELLVKEEVIHDLVGREGADDGVEASATKEAAGPPEAGDSHRDLPDEGV